MYFERLSVLLARRTPGFSSNSSRILSSLITRRRTSAPAFRQLGNRNPVSLARRIHRRITLTPGCRSRTGNRSAYKCLATRAFSHSVRNYHIGIHLCSILRHFLGIYHQFTFTSIAALVQQHFANFTLIGY